MRAILPALLVLSSVIPASTLAGQRYALVIGIDGYQELGKLTTCVADAKALAKVLVERCGFPEAKVVVLTDDAAEPQNKPTLATMRRRIAQFRQLTEKDDTILLFFSGHGLTKDGQKPGEKEGFLIPIDGDPANAIPVSWVVEEIEKSPAATKLLVLDTCHAGAAKGVGGIAPSMATTLMFLSCGKDQVSYPDEATGHSVFSRYLVEGMQGGADANKDKQITLQELADYVKGQMKDWCLKTGRSQVPEIRGTSATTLRLAEVSERPVVVKPPEPEPKPQVQVYTRWPFDAQEARRRQEETAKALGVKVEDDLDLGRGERINLVLIPAGEFMMGDTQTPEEVDKRWPGGQLEWYKWAQPRHRVKLTKPFYLGECEVTRGQFAVFTRDADYKTDAEKAGKALVLKDNKWGEQEGFSWRNPNFQQTDRHPAVCISWNDAVAFCEWASKKTGRIVSLPTESQWEYACRAGTDGIWPWGEREEDTQGKANVASDHEEINYPYRFRGVSDGFTYTAPVGTFAANCFGLKDMIGNAWEWCSDWLGKGYYGESPPQDPSGPPDGRLHVVRGGTWHHDPKGCRSAYRHSGEPTYALSSRGFRVVVFLRPF